MRFQVLAGTALSTLLATSGALADTAPTNKADSTGEAKERLETTQEALLRAQLEQSRLQTQLLALAVGELCAQSETDLPSCTLIGEMQSSGMLELTEISALPGLAAPSAPVVTTAQAGKGETRAAAAPGPLAAANVTAACVVGDGTDSTQCGISADATGEASVAVGSLAFAGADNGGECHRHQQGNQVTHGPSFQWARRTSDDPTGPVMPHAGFRNA